jgi:ABC-type multidrug transport system ATPase subunit
MTAIALSDVTKSFGTHRAVDELSLSVPEGSVYGFIGPNGSGKTTTLRMIMMSVPGMLQSVMEEKNTTHCRIIAWFHQTI